MNGFDISRKEGTYCVLLLRLWLGKNEVPSLSQARINFSTSTEPPLSQARIDFSTSTAPPESTATIDFSTARHI